MKLMPAFSGSDRKSTVDVLVSLPLFKKINGITGQMKNMQMWKLYINMKPTTSREQIEKFKLRLHSINYSGVAGIY